MKERAARLCYKYCFENFLLFFFICFGAEATYVELCTKWEIGGDIHNSFVCIFQSITVRTLYEIEVKQWGRPQGNENGDFVCAAKKKEERREKWIEWRKQC